MLPDYKLEAFKLAGQFASTLVVAGLAVLWALRRFKSEKTWERKLAGYADIAMALSEMKLVVAARVRDEERHREPSDEDNWLREERFVNARRKLDDGAALAILLLSGKTNEVLQTLISDLENLPQFDTYYEYQDNLLFLLTNAHQALIKAGRTELKVKMT